MRRLQGGRPRIAAIASWLLLLSGLALAGPDATVVPRKGAERVVLHTIAGPLVIALYPDVAPGHVAQILKLVALGAYDTTHFCRIEPTFVMQLSTVMDRLEPLSNAQRLAVHPLKAEFSRVAHRRGCLTMARMDADENSAETSFSILLADAPHLDGRYTVFGELESGWDVIAELLKVPTRRGTEPLVRLTVRSAAIVTDPTTLDRLRRTSPSPVSIPESARSTASFEGEPRRAVTVGMVLLMMLVSLLEVMMRKHIPSRSRNALPLINLAIGGFLIFVLLAPEAPGHGVLSVSLFIGLVSLLKLMSWLENSES